MTLERLIKFQHQQRPLPLSWSPDRAQCQPWLLLILLEALGCLKYLWNVCHNVIIMKFFQFIRIADSVVIQTFCQKVSCWTVAGFLLCEPVENEIKYACRSSFLWLLKAHRRNSSSAVIDDKTPGAEASRSTVKIIILILCSFFNNRFIKRFPSLVWQYSLMAQF